MQKDDMIIFMENNKELVRQSNLHELAERLHTSESSLSRKIKRHYGCSFLELKEKFRQYINEERTNNIATELLNFYDRYKNILKIFSERIKVTNIISIRSKNLTEVPIEYLLMVMKEEKVTINLDNTENDIVEFNFNKINQHKIIITLNEDKIIIESRYKLMLYFSYAIAYLLCK